ncbi:MAG: ribose 5-phosphate isomerase B [Clostridia bacterium]|nr:ribose 5-phosphate isomerase B [Clostridia bacterium]
MKIALGCDHGGIVLKDAVLGYLKDNGYEVEDFGIFEQVSTNYAPIAVKVARSITSGESDKGILLCGTGIGMSLAANKVHGIRAAVCSELFSCEYTRRHNDANILCLGGRVVDNELAVKMVETFLTTEFEGGRHQTRIDEIAAIERGEM